MCATAHLYLCVYIYIYIHMYVPLYVYIHTHVHMYALAVLKQTQLPPMISLSWSAACVYTSLTATRSDVPCSWQMCSPSSYSYYELERIYESINAGIAV